MSELLKHISKSRFGSCDTIDLFQGKRVKHWKAFEIRQTTKCWLEPSHHNFPHQFKWGRIKLHAFNCAIPGNMNRIIKPVLNITIKRGNESVPQSAFCKNEKADAIKLMHRFYNTCEKGFSSFVGIIISSGKQKIFQLIKCDNHRNAEFLHYTHHGLEKRKHKVLPTWMHFKIEFCKAISKKACQFSFILKQNRSSKTL